MLRELQVKEFGVCVHIQYYYLKIKREKEYFFTTSNSVKMRVYVWHV